MLSFCPIWWNMVNLDRKLDPSSYPHLFKVEVTSNWVREVEGSGSHLKCHRLWLFILNNSWYFKYFFTCFISLGQLWKLSFIIFTKCSCFPCGVDLQSSTVLSQMEKVVIILHFYLLSFSLSVSHPEYHITFSSHAYWGSSWLWQCVTIPCFSYLDGSCRVR